MTVREMFARRQALMAELAAIDEDLLRFIGEWADCRLFLQTVAPTMAALEVSLMPAPREPHGCKVKE